MERIMNKASNLEKIHNMFGKKLELNAHEQMIANYVEGQIQNVGYEIDLTSLTTIMKNVVEQKFFQIAPSDFMPVRAGEGAWSGQLTTYRSFQVGDDFSTGIINTGTNGTRLATTNVQLDAVNIKVGNWAKAHTWTLFDLQMAMRAGNWDVIVSLEKARKKNWDLGIQSLAFLGLKDDTTNFPGLLNQSDVTTDTATITGFIKATSSADFVTFVTKIYQVYRANCNYTAKPTHFIVPEYDYNGLVAPYSESFPIKTKLAALQEAFAMLTQNPNFKILPLAYANKSLGGLSKNMYCLLNYDSDSLRLDIPVMYQNTMANSTDNFSFTNVGYGQLTGVKAYRAKEMLYFSHTTADT